MWRDIIYLRPGGRRPVRTGGYAAGVDMQGEIPAGWCDLCGREVYDRRKFLCEECERWGEYEGENIRSTAAALPRMFTGCGQIQL